MTRTRLLLSGGAGLALLAFTVAHSAGVGSGGGDRSAPGHDSARSARANRGVEHHTAAAAHPAAPVRVAAEGRVVAYPGAEVRVGTEEAGLLLRLDVVENREVRAGDVLAEIDSRLLREALAELTAGIAETEAEIRLARLELDRREELRRRQVVSAQDVDTARRNLEIGLARKSALEARAAQLRTRINRTRITAPISGTIVARHADAGEVVEAGAALVTIADLTRVRIEAEADESDAGLVSPGDPVRIRADGWGDREWTGVVEEVPGWVTPRALKSRDPARPTDTRVLPVKVAFAEPTPLRLGQTVEMTILPRPRAD